MVRLQTTTVYRNGFCVLRVPGCCYFQRIISSKDTAALRCAMVGSAHLVHAAGWRIRLGETLMAVLFEPTVIHGMSLANRFVRSATWEGMAATDGTCTGQLTDTMVKLAEGGVGLIITGHSYVSREGQAGPWQMGIHDDGTLPGLTQMTEAVHRHGGNIAVQLAHAGAQAAASLSGLDARDRQCFIRMARLSAGR